MSDTDRDVPTKAMLRDFVDSYPGHTAGTIVDHLHRCLTERAIRLRSPVGDNPPTAQMKAAITKAEGEDA